MANKEHLKILKQGVEAWNEWRTKNPGINPDLSAADLKGAYLGKANLTKADLTKADLTKAGLSRAKLSNAKLKRSSLYEANLTMADLSKADLNYADLGNANLSYTKLQDAKLKRSSLYEANLTEANLTEANLSDANLFGANLNMTYVGWTTFGNIDFSKAKNLDTLHHRGPSSIGVDTLYLSKGSIPEAFLRGCGFTELQIEQAKLADSELSPAQVTDIGYKIIELHSNQTPLEFYSCFISHSSKDENFTKQLHARMQEEKLRTWYAPEDLKIGAKIRTGIDEAIRIYDKLLLILTKQSIESKWVEDEVESAFEKEANQNKTVLFPIRLDNAVMETKKAWAAKIRRTRNIGDFRKWETHDDFQKSFQRLLRDLQAEEQSKE